MWGIPEKNCQKLAQQFKLEKKEKKKKREREKG